MLYSSGLFRTTLPQRKDADGLIWLEAAGYAKMISSGCIALLPPAVLVLEKITGAFRKFCREQGFWEIFLPSLQEMSLWEASGRSERFAGLFCETTLNDGKKYVINPTQEESIVNLFCQSDFREKDLPLRFFQIGERIRNELQPSHGFIRSRSFVMGDMYILARDERELNKEARRIEEIMRLFFGWLGLPFKKSPYYFASSGAAADSFWVPSATKQCFVSVCASCGNSYRFGNKTMDSCPTCGHPMENVPAVELGDVVRHGTIITEKMGAIPIGGEKPIYAAVGGIGLSRLMQILAEYYHDEHGLVWPIEIAPFEIHLIANQERVEEAKKLAESLEMSGCQVLLDLRDQSIGRSLVDADLLGIPLRVVLANKTTVGKFDIKVRKTGAASIGDITELLEIRKLLCGSKIQFGK